MSANLHTDNGTSRILDHRETWLVAPITGLGMLIAFGLFASAHAHGDHDHAQDSPPDAAEVAQHDALPADLEAQLVEVRISTRLSGAKRVITADGLPDHATGTFPNRNNPNSIRAQSYRFTVDASPQLTGRITSSQGLMFGVALNGVVFDPGTAEYYRGDRSWRMEAIGGPRNLGLDRNNAHVQPSGAYHYHGLPTALVATLGGTAKPVQIGWAADGFAIYSPFGWPEGKARSSWQLKSGTRSGGPGGRPDGSYTRDWEYKSGSGTLDACNGRMLGGQYVYVLTDSFPFIPRCFRGSPDQSFSLRARGGGGQGTGAGRQGGSRGGAPPSRGAGGFRPPPPPWAR